MASGFLRVSAQVDLTEPALEMAKSTDNDHKQGPPQTVQQSSPYSNTTNICRPSITTLPTEIHFKILKHLHIVHATCLGLTNRVLYSALKGLYPHKVSVDPYAYSYNWAEIGLLGDYLKVWMKPRLLWDGFVFVTPSRYRELEDKDYELSLRAQMEDSCKY